MKLFKSETIDCLVGENVVFHKPNLVNIYGAEKTCIGNNTTVAAFVEIQAGSTIKDNCKISSFCFIPEGTIIENEVFLGQNVSICNDKRPRAVLDGILKTNKDWFLQPVLIKSGASIGSNSTILPGVTIGKNAVIGAGSVVSRSIPDNTVAFGNPARVARMVDF